MRSFSFFVCHFRFGSPLNGCMGLVALSVVSVWNPPSYVLVLGVTYFPPRTPPPLHQSACLSILLPSVSSLAAVVVPVCRCCALSACSSAREL